LSLTIKIAQLRFLSELAGRIIPSWARIRFVFKELCER
jgi:hypothetical protein